jgi:DNA-binding beta-propeller fold protein YncE
MQIGKSGTFDSSDGTRNGTPLNSNEAQFFLPSALDVDESSGDIYVADGELIGGNSRVAVLSRDGRFLRQWSLFRTGSDKNIAALPHCLRLSNDGQVYVCDREADRIQVFDKQGNFIKNIFVKFSPVSSPDDRASGNRGSAVVLGFSADQEQRYMFVVNQNSVMIDVLERQSGEKISSFGGGPGRYPGQFTLPHGIGVDSLGNVYIAEQEGRRIQKYSPIE